MFRFVRLTALLLCVLAVTGSVLAAEVDCGDTYCFSTADFSRPEDSVVGICITELPDADTGTVMLGKRVLRVGDILADSQLSQMTFLPLRTQEDRSAQMTFLPIYESRVEKPATMTIAIRGKEDKAPVAIDSSLETYKNLPNQGKLNVSDPEDEALTYTLVRAPKRGQVVINEDGTFTYTPKKNKVGVDSFTYTAADPAGNVSRTATVTVQILKPTDSDSYTDTVGLDCRFTAEWLRNTGLFVGERISGQPCFYPEKTVSRGEFLAMAVKILDIPAEDASYTGMPENTPQWLRPYLAAAMRSGLVAGLPDSEAGGFDAEKPITGAEAAVILQNALDLTLSEQALDAQQTSADVENAAPAWAKSSLTILGENGIALGAAQELTRADISQVFYTVSRLALNAPGTAVFRRQG